MSIVDAIIQIFPAITVIYNRQWVEKNLDQCVKEAAAYAVMEQVDDPAAMAVLVEYLKLTMGKQVVAACDARARAHAAMRAEQLRIARLQAKRTGKPINEEEFSDILEGGQ